MTVTCERIDELASIYSDLYKDTYGVRPLFTTDWTVDRYEREIESLAKQFAWYMEKQAQLDQEAILNFEKRIEDCIRLGAADRQSAIKWIEQSEEASGDHLKYLLGLPYNYKL